MPRGYGLFSEENISLFREMESRDKVNAKSNVKNDYQGWENAKWPLSTLYLFIHTYMHYVFPLQASFFPMGFQVVQHPLLIASRDRFKERAVQVNSSQLSQRPSAFRSHSV